MVISAELARVYASAPTDDDVVETLELAHPNFSRTWYIVSKAYPFAANLEGGAPVTFDPLPFAVVLPSKSGEGQQDLGVSIDNVDQAIIDELEAANADPTTKITATYRAYTASDPGAPAFILPALALTDIVATDTSVKGTATRTDVINRPFPSVLYTIQLFPGLDR